MINHKHLYIILRLLFLDQIIINLKIIYLYYKIYYIHIYSKKY